MPIPRRRFDIPLALTGLALAAAALLLHSISTRAQFFENFISPGPLARPHEQYEGVSNCTVCHTIGSKYYDDRCLDCHLEIKKRMDKRLGFHADKTKCEQCHSDHKGKNFQMIDLKATEFDHLDTGYILRGKHGGAKCEDCHSTFRADIRTKKPTNTRTYLDTPKLCYGCHEKDYTHNLSKKYNYSCQLCHDETAEKFKTLRRFILFNHDTTRYKLTGLHGQVPCLKCHRLDDPKKRYFKPVPFQSCETCHEDTHKGIFGRDCKSCHTTTTRLSETPAVEPGKPVKESTKPAAGREHAKKIKAGRFDHDKTSYPLKGLHVDVKCAACHPGTKTGDYKVERFSSCADCHTNPHGSQLKAYACKDCHPETSTWSEVRFGVDEHNDKSAYKLDGQHADLTCIACHYDGTYKNIPYKKCDSCHRNPHPPEQLKVGRLDGSCEACHTTASFSKNTFDHDKSRFKLEAKHKTVDCFLCHLNQEFKPAPIKCQECHKHPHGKSIPQTCDECHTAEGFTIVPGFKHEAYAGWALDGGHARLRCVKCHPNHLRGKYELGNKQCISCHIDVHENANGRACERCHVTETWESGRRALEHDLGFFALEGKHDKLPCYRCHVDTGLKSQGAGMTCISCHQMADVHRGALGTECGDCHRQTGWTPSRFDHNRTNFDLSGAHRYLTCKDCHKNNLYAGLPEDCIFCHQKNFIATITLVPDHNPAGTTDVMMCNQCHNTVTWKK